jgi:LAO/AO transport system kinase
LIDLSKLSVEEFVSGIRKNNRVILARTITLLESTVSSHQEKAYLILEKCLPYTGQSIRIGITGAPGVGKSTFIETFGKLLLGEGKKLAVIAIDPSSKKNKGSILGDKTRMQDLSKLEHVFIRPTASGDFAGGVASKTREVILILEAAGYDTILIETVGVGQSETSVYEMTDIFLLLLLAGAGDELQGIKRGIMEMADVIAINKSDGNNAERVQLAKSEFKRAVKLFPLPESGRETIVKSCSGLTGDGITEIWKAMNEFISAVKHSYYFENKRKSQLKTWVHEMLYADIILQLIQQPEFKSRLQEIENQIDQSGGFSLSSIRGLINGFANHNK